jgi:magnesium-transporting ATPase (P-type)
MENFEDKINQILLGAAAVSIVIGLVKEGFPDGLTEGLSICLALVIIITVSSANNYSSERQLAEMVSKSSKQEVAVYRGSTTEKITIDNDDLVVGDLVAFDKGMNVPADMIMVDGQDVECTETELTGEPDGVKKVALDSENYKDGVMCTMLAKSQIADGQGKALVTAVGTYTVAGIISEKTAEDSEVNKMTPLQ